MLLRVCLGVIKYGKHPKFFLTSLIIGLMVKTSSGKTIWKASKHLRADAVKRDNVTLREGGSRPSLVL